MHTFEELRREHDDSQRVFGRRMRLLFLVIMPGFVGLLILFNWAVLEPLRERSQMLSFAVGVVAAIPWLIGCRVVSQWTFAPLEKPAFRCPQCGKELLNQLTDILELTPGELPDELLSWRCPECDQLIYRVDKPPSHGAVDSA
jgi:predicted RNA-binding Zn-ribbon protein involved in translation (DUF1610 family)